MFVFFFFKQKTAYEMRISDWSSDVCSSVLAISEAPRIPIETPKLTGSINLKGARIDDIVLPTYNQTIKKDSPPVRLFSPSGTKDSYFGGFGWRSEEHTSELQSLMRISSAVFCLKKKKPKNKTSNNTSTIL